MHEQEKSSNKDRKDLVQSSIKVKLTEFFSL